MFCWKCGNEINEGDKFCTKCGAQQFKVCTKCQKRISIFDGFCIYCGEKLIAPKAVQKPKQKQKDQKNFKTYSFKFSNIKLNASKRDEINKWLSENNVIIHYLKPRFYLNTSWPGKWQASIDTLDIVYEPAETNQNYYFEYASVLGWIKRPTEKLEKYIMIGRKHTRNIKSYGKKKQTFKQQDLNMRCPYLYYVRKLNKNKRK